MAFSGAFFGALAALGALGAAGCSVRAHAGGDVYCDNTGCYQCDDNGSCTPVAGSGGNAGTSGATSGSATIDSGSVTVTPRNPGAGGDSGAGASSGSPGADGSAPVPGTDASASQADAAPPPPPPDCVTTADCKAEVPQTCVGGYCRYTCATDLQCAEIDARLDVCNTAGYCASSE